jgi:hypothetical protein
MENNCPRVEKCALFQKDLLYNKDSEKWYHKLYCHNGEEGMKKCLRYNVFLELGYCPDELLPFTTKSFEEVIAQIKSAENK